MKATESPRRSNAGSAQTVAASVQGFLRALLNILFWPARDALCNLVSPNHAQGDHGLCKT